MCIFCKIVAGEATGFKIYENAETLAILDISNDFKGHTLVMPKKHYVNVLDCAEDVLASVMRTVKKVSKHYVDNCGYDGVNIFVNNGESAGQTVMHLHVHIVPQKNGKPQHLFIKPDEVSRDLKTELLHFQLSEKTK